MALTVLQIVPSMTVGGVETGTVDLSRALISRGHRAIVISSGGPLVSDLEAAGAIHYLLPVHRKNPWVIVPLVRRVAEIVESHGVDVIHARSRVPAIIGYLAWRRVVRAASFRLGDRQRVPCFITTAHGYYSTHLFSRVMGWGRIVIAISERIARHMIDDFGVQPERVQMIPRGVALERFAWKQPRPSAPGGEWRLAAIGRLTSIKGHPDLLRAFAIVLKSFPNARLLVVGRAAPEQQRYLRELQGLAGRLGIAGRVEFTGHEHNVPRLMSEIDLAVLPSTGLEAFGRVLIEAGAAGVPVVATRVGGMAEVVIDRKTGLLVPPGEPMALASAILTLLRDRPLAVELSKAARRRVESVYPLARMVEQTLDVYQEAAGRPQILVIKLGAIGDIALITPSLRALRARFPSAHIRVLVGREGRELLQRCPYVDDLVMMDRREDRDLRALLRLAARIRAGQVDMVVDFQNNRISHWLGWLCGAPQRYGYGGRRWSWLLTHRMTLPPDPMPPVEQQFRLLQLLGIQGGSSHLELWPGALDEERACSLLRESWVAENQPLIAVHPGGHPRWLSKRWPAERYAHLIDELAGRIKARVVITGSPPERGLAEEICRAAKSKPVLAAGQTSLNELAALIRRCSVFVGGDTAALHVAAAVGTPLVALFGSTHPVRHLPPSPHVKLLRKELPCSPCYRSICYRTGNGYMECMRLISVEEVLEAVVSHLKIPSQGNPVSSR